MTLLVSREKHELVPRLLATSYLASNSNPFSLSTKIGIIIIIIIKRFYNFFNFQRLLTLTFYCSLIFVKKNHIFAFLGDSYARHSFE